MIISIDVGYGQTKGVSSTGRRIMFPSVVAPLLADDPTDGIFKNPLGYKVTTRNFSQTSVNLVGDAAVTSSFAVQTMAQEKPAEIHDLLVLTAAYLLGAGSSPQAPETSTLVLGLPLAFYKSQKNELSKRMMTMNSYVSAHRLDETAEEKRIAFSEVYVLPQGAGALVATGERPDCQYVGVIDVGHYTTDYMLIEMINGNPVPVVDVCGSVEAGVHLVEKMMATVYQNQTGVPMSLVGRSNELQRVLSGQPLMFRGKELHITHEVIKACQQVSMQVIEAVRTAWGKMLDKVGMTILAGGGAKLLGDYLMLAFPNTIFPPDPVFANADGFLKMVIDQERKDVSAGEAVR